MFKRLFSRSRMTRECPVRFYEGLSGKFRGSTHQINQQEMHYYGIISGISKRIGLIEEIDKMTKSDPNKKVSFGQSVLAIMLNGMGLAMSKPLYKVEEFLRTKPVNILIGKGIKAKDFNDDTLGRALDAIAEYGTSKMFSTIALKAAALYKISTKFFHADTSNVGMAQKQPN